MKGKRVMIYGATGGLGRALVKRCLDLKAEVILSGRSRNKLMELQKQMGGEIRPMDFTSLLKRELFDDVDILINTTGVDVRKFLKDQSEEEIHTQLQVNLLGTIHLIKAALNSFQRRGSGTIMQVGAFGDGNWPTPCYSVDVATRAGVYAFLESLRQEITQRDIHLLYFCPLPADTEAERPFLSLWKDLGIQVVSPKEVAHGMIEAVEKRKERSMMGGFLTRWVYKLRRKYPRLIEKGVVAPMSRKTRDFFTLQGA